LAEASKGGGALFDDAAVEEIETAGCELLAHCKEAFGDSDRLFTSQLIDKLNGRDESPWLEMRNGYGINDRMLGKRLGEYDIKSKTITIGSDHLKGYMSEDFRDAWERYLPPERGEGDKGDKRDIIDNQNKDVTDVTDVTLPPYGERQK
jgi:Protein of unknown function (DUF3631)